MPQIPQGPIPLGVDHLTVCAMPPVEFIDLAGEAGLQSVSLLVDSRHDVLGFPEWSLVDEPALRRAVRGRLADGDVRLAQGEGCRIEPGADVARCARVIEAFADIGTERLNIVSFEYDAAREADQLEQLAGMIHAAGLGMTFEYSRRGRRTLVHVAELVRRLRTGGAAAGVLIDPMHFVRGGEEIATLAALAREPGLIAYFQICDVPLIGVGDYSDEAMNRRLPPGEGELPLAAMIDVLPEGVVWSMEIPQLALARTGVSHLERVTAAAARSRELLAGRAERLAR